MKLVHVLETVTGMLIYANGATESQYKLNKRKENVPLFLNIISEAVAMG